MMENVYFHGKIVPKDEAKIGIASHTIQYGTGCFSGIRGHLIDSKARAFRLEDHFERLMDAVKILGMDFSMSFLDFTKIISSLVAANKPRTGFYFRPFIYSESEVLTPKFEGLDYDIAIYMIELGDYLDTSRGLRLMVSSWQKFSGAAIPTKAKACGSYLNSSLARSEAIRLGYDEALVMDSDWNIVEGSAENIFIMYRGEAIFPQLGSSMLEGITMRTVIELLKEEKIPIRFEKIDRSMIYTCDELLLLGTAAQVVFAESVDGRRIGEEMGPVCKLLCGKFEDLLNMKHKNSASWVTQFNY